MTDERPRAPHPWRLYHHPLFAGQLEALVEEVASQRAHDPGGYRTTPRTKRLAAIVRLTDHVIPADPTQPRFRLCNTLDPEHRRWRRAVFLERYRLFFRFDADARVVVYAWVNDDRTLRSRGARNDPYAVFQRRLAAGDPPTAWDALLAAAHPAGPVR